MQKSPSLEILLLDRLLPQRSHHIVTLRHPFGHHSVHHPTINTAIERLEHWVASWAYALRQLASLDRYASFDTRRSCSTRAASPSSYERG